MPNFSLKTDIFQITIIIAPSLPLALSIAVYYAIRRLKEDKIKVALPNSINIAGKVKMCVFDKTGKSTLITIHFAHTSHSLITN